MVGKTKKRSLLAVGLPALFLLLGYLTWYIVDKKAAKFDFSYHERDLYIMTLNPYPYSSNESWSWTVNTLQTLQATHHCGCLVDYGFGLSRGQMEYSLQVKEDVVPQTTILYFARFTGHSVDENVPAEVKGYQVRFSEDGSIAAVDPYQSESLAEEYRQYAENQRVLLEESDAWEVTG